MLSIGELDSLCSFALEFETYVSDGHVGLIDVPFLVLVNYPGDVNLFFAVVD